MPSCPRKVSPSMATIDGDHLKSGVVREANASTSLSLNALIASVATATVSPDIALLRQPGGFEGFGPGRVRTPVGEKAVTDREDLDDLEGHFVLTALRHSVQCGHGDDLITGVQEF